MDHWPVWYVCGQSPVGLANNLVRPWKMTFDQL